MRRPILVWMEQAADHISLVTNSLTIHKWLPEERVARWPTCVQFRAPASANEQSEGTDEVSDVGRSVSTPARSLTAGANSRILSTLANVRWFSPGGHEAKLARAREFLEKGSSQNWNRYSPAFGLTTFQRLNAWKHALAICRKQKGLKTGPLADICLRPPTEINRNEQLGGEIHAWRHLVTYYG
jgi:hypothetical protein